MGSRRHRKPRHGTIVAYLKPKRGKRVIALPYNAAAERSRTMASLKNLTKKHPTLHYQDLYAELWISKVSMRFQRIADDDEYAEHPIHDKELDASLTFWEMDFGKENGKNVNLTEGADYFGGKLVRKTRKKWVFEVNPSEYKRPIPNERASYIRVVSSANPDRYMLVPIDPEKIGYLGADKKEGKRYEVSLQLEVDDPGFDPIEGDAVSLEREPEKKRLFPDWWNHETTSRGRLPVLYATLDKPKEVTEKELKDAIEKYFHELDQWLRQHVLMQEKALSFFRTVPDPDAPDPPEEEGPGVWSLLKSAYDVATIAFPALKALDVAITLVEAWDLPAEVPTATKNISKNVKGRAKQAAYTILEAGKRTVKFLKTVDAVVLAGQPERRGGPKPSLKASDFVQRAINKLALMAEHQFNAALTLKEELETSVANGIESEEDRRTLLWEMQEALKEVRRNMRRIPSYAKLLGNLYVQYMNANGLGLVTWTLPGGRYAWPDKVKPKGKTPPDHSHVAGQTEGQIRQVHEGLMNFPGGVFKKGGHLYVSSAAKRKHLKGLKGFDELKGSRMMSRHFSWIPGENPDIDLKKSSHYVHEFRLSHASEMRVKWDWSETYRRQYYKFIRTRDWK